MPPCMTSWRNLCAYCASILSRLGPKSVPRATSYSVKSVLLSVGIGSVLIRTATQPRVPPKFIVESNNYSSKCISCVQAAKQVILMNPILNILPRADIFHLKLYKHSKLQFRLKNKRQRKFSNKS
jgi:hypothetical protein